ncbi:MAG: nuclear transport factor 2 family protein [Bacteroidota bacterium]
MSEEEQLIKVFYTCFQRKDWKGMLDCYHKDIFFYDAIFQNLEGPEVHAMWEMLLRNAKDLELSFSNIQMEPDSTYGSCNWVATYTFSQTGRRIVNKGKALFTFSEGKIAEHQDVWSLWRWIRQALGFPGFLLGWTPILQNKIRRQARQNLEKFRARSVSSGDGSASSSPA